MNLKEILLLCLALNVYSAGAQSEVFAPGIVSIEEENIYRGVFHPNGKSYFFFRKVSEGENYRIFVSELNKNGWSKPKMLNLGGYFSDLYPTVSPDGERMVFSSYRPLPDGRIPKHAALWQVNFVTGEWINPQYLSEANVFSNYHPAPLFRVDGDLQFVSITPDWKSRKHKLISWDGTKYYNLRDDDLLLKWEKWAQENTKIWEAVKSPVDNLIIFTSNNDIWYSVKHKGSDWTDPILFDSQVNDSDQVESFPAFSPDGKYLFYTRAYKTIRKIRVKYNKLKRTGK